MAVLACSPAANHRADPPPDQGEVRVDLSPPEDASDVAPASPIPAPAPSTVGASALEPWVTRLRDGRRSRLEPRARGFLVDELVGLERLDQQTADSSPDKVQLTRRLAEGYVELESAAERE